MLLVLSKFWLFCLLVMQYLLLQNPNVYVKEGHAVTLEHQSGYSVAPVIHGSTASVWRLQ